MYLTFVPAIQILNSYDFQLFNLPTSYPDAKLTGFSTI